MAVIIKTFPIQTIVSYFETRQLINTCQFGCYKVIQACLLNQYILCEIKQLMKCGTHFRFFTFLRAVPISVEITAKR